MLKNHIFVVPARGGSKRLPRKNIQPLWGKPLIMHAIDAALNAAVPGKKIVVVSSEDPEILEYAKSIKGIYALERPLAIAEDHVPTQPVLKHAVCAIESSQRLEADIVWWMNVSVPEVTANDLVAGYEFLLKNDLNEVTTVNSGGLAYAAVRLMKRHVLFADSLSTHFGVIKRDYVDVHRREDIEHLEKRGR